MEKVNFKNERGSNLAGAFHPANKEYAIIMAHGSPSSKDQSRLVELAEEFNENDFSVLRFDFSGSGESDGGDIIIGNQVEDLEAAMNYIKERGYTKLGLFGESLGGLISLMCYREDVKALGLWAPMTSSRTPTMLDNEEKVRELEEKRYITKELDGKTYRFPQELFDEINKIDQESLISRVNAPTLIIHGNQDEGVPVADSSKAMRYFPKNSKIRYVEGMGHTPEYTQELTKEILNWFNKYLK